MSTELITGCETLGPGLNSMNIPNSEAPRKRSGEMDESDRRRSNIALGLERFGAIGLRAPVPVRILFVVLVALAIVGVQRIRIDDSLSQLFRSNSPEFWQFEQVSRAFPSAEYDVLVVIEGKDVLARESVEKLRTLVADLQLIDGARGVISMFSARQPGEKGGLPKPLFPDPLPEGAAYDALVQRVKTNELIRGKLLSERGDLALIVLSLDPGVVGRPATGEGHRRHPPHNDR